jgi:hypothetical protein
VGREVPLAERLELHEDFGLEVDLRTAPEEEAGLGGARAGSRLHHVAYYNEGLCSFTHFAFKLIF